MTATKTSQDILGDQIIIITIIIIINNSNNAYIAPIQFYSWRFRKLRYELKVNQCKTKIGKKKEFSFYR